MSEQYEVLSPWAERAAVPLLGIQPRLSNLSGKTIGFVENNKKAAVPILREVERTLKIKFPTMKSAGVYQSSGGGAYAAPLEGWLKGVDAVVLAIGD